MMRSSGSNAQQKGQQTTGVLRLNRYDKGPNQ
jgi:hypothetical protein